MISMSSIREEFGLAKRLTPSTFYSCLELGKGVTHYYFHSVRGKLPDLVTTCSDAEDPDFAVWLLEAVASRIDTCNDAPLKFGFSKPNSFGFDSVLALQSPYHGHLKGVLNDKHATLVQCVPIHNCEFTGTESVEEYRQWQTRVGVERWKRNPYPFVAMEFENPRSAYGNPMQRTSMEACLSCLSELIGVTKGFAKIANVKGDIILIKPLSHKRYQIAADKTKRECTSDDLIVFVNAFVTTGEIPGLSS